MKKSNSLLKHFQSTLPSIDERIERGKALRIKRPRIEQGEYYPSKRRTNPVSVLENQAKTRLKELVPIRYARMLQSPFAFLRGAAAIMAEDLSVNDKSSGIMVQACGDLHLANFGVFASAERKLIFGINDFDETLRGPWEWDLKRLVASVVVACRFLGGSEELCKESVMATVASYRKRMKQYAQMGNLELWYSSIDEGKVLGVLSPTARKGAEKIMAKARTRTHMQVLGKLTDIVDKKNLFREDAPFIIHQTHTQSGRPIEEALGLFLESYFDSLPDDRKNILMNYRIVDVVRKIVGVGSVGTRCWVVYLMGNHDEDPLFLQVKEAQPSVLEPFLEKSQYNNQGQRVVVGQRMIQGAPDILLGWGLIDSIHFYVRQLRDMKGGIEFDREKVIVGNTPQYGALCAWATAQAHAKSGDAAIIAGYAGNSDELDEAMSRFAFAYADQTEKDFKALTAAAKSKKIKVASATE